MSVGLVGYGKAGTAVINVLAGDLRFDLRWIVRRTADHGLSHPSTMISIFGLDKLLLCNFSSVFRSRRMVDFSSRRALADYGEEVKRCGLMLVSAVSAYSSEELAYARRLAENARVLCSPNITLGINFLIVAARLLRCVAPFADVEIIEQHFRDKQEVSGTARRIAERLGVGAERITSLRLGGIVGHHEVIFGFPHQTVRLTHESIRREAFGTGVAFALEELAHCAPGPLFFEDLLFERLRAELLK